MLQAGEHVGPYRVASVIGRGGMATVYRVVDLRDATDWALKVLTIEDAGLAERFVAEAQMQAQLHHPHVVRARELLRIDERLGIVMEYVEGPSLDQWIHEHPDAPVKVKLDIALQVLDGVAAAHRQHMIHRDLKPGNVLIALHASGRPLAKVTDFGLGKLRGAAARTRTGIAMGTPRYMAPEQLLDAKSVDNRADVYAMGALLYELFTGRPAFQHTTFAEAFEAVETSTYEDPARFGVPGRVRRAIRKALVTDVERRVESCEDLADLLRGRIRRSVRRRVGRILLLSAMLILALGGLGWWFQPG